MKKICAIITMMAIILTGCGAQKEASSAAQSSSVQSSSAQSLSAQAETAEETGVAAETASSSKPAAEEEREESKAADEENEGAENTMRLLIGEREVPVAWEGNASVNALKDLCPITIQMSRYGGFEQVGPIGQNIVREDEQTVTDSGDIVLYSGNQIVIFYGSNSWAYTRLGKITDKNAQQLKELLGNGDVTITITAE